MADIPKPASFAPFFILIAIVIALWAFGGRIKSQNGYNYQAPSTLEDIEGEVIRIKEETQDLQKEAAHNKLIGSLSPLSKYISLENANVWSNDPQNEYLEINVSSDVPNDTLLTGLEIKSAMTGRGVIIGKGVYLPNFSLSNPEEVVYLKPGDKVYLITGRSPIGYSFKVNKCSGYFSQSGKIYPSIYNCPNPRDEKLPEVGANYRNACYDFIDSLSNCSIPNPDIETFWAIGPECSQYVTTKINYDSCVERHRQDLDFFKPDWRVYLNRDEELWDSKRELIKLLDLNKQTVDYVEI